MLNGIKSIKRIPHSAGCFLMWLGSTGRAFNNLNDAFLTVFLFFFVSVTFSQPFYIKKYTVNDGLPASYILKIFQDSDGFMWVSTYNGLSRFDGKIFTNYGYESGLPHIMIDAIFEDSKHRLWIGTRNGIAQVMGKRCVAYAVDDNHVINYIFRFHEFQNGYLWALTSKGVYQFENNVWKKVKLYPGFENHSCRSVVETDSGLIINYGHHLVIKKKSGDFQLLGQIGYDDSPGPLFNEVYKHHQRLYINNADEIFEIDGIDTTALYSDELRGRYILHTYKDSRDRFWIYTLHDQLMISAPGDNQHFIYKQPMKLVSGFCEDREGNMWVAGEDGLLKIKTVDYESYGKRLRPPISGNCNVIKTSESRLLVSSTNNSFFIISDALGTVQPGYKSLKSSATHSEIIDGWCNDEQDRTWLIFRDERDLFLMENNQLKSRIGLVNRNIHQLKGVAYSSKTHKLYVCADTLQTGDDKRLDNFKARNSDKIIADPTCIHYFSNGRILLGTRNSGFFIIDDRDNIFPVPKENNLVYYHSTGGVFIFDDPSGKFWITSSYGMVRYKWDEKMYPVKDLEITTGQGLPNNAVRSLAFDRFNRIWAATLAGIVVIELGLTGTSPVIVNRLSEEQGITSDFWAEARLASDKNGNIWIGLYNQLLMFDPVLVKFENSLPFIAIDNVQLNFKETSWSQWTDSVTGIRQIPYQPVLPYNKNSLGISFKGISYSYTSGMEYSYRLDGTDTNWSIPTKSEFVSFVGLPPGKFKFKVRTRKSNTDWSQPAAFSFIILKPYWSTWWFRLLIIAVAGGAIFLIYRVRLNQLRKVMAVRMKISRDLHDEVGSTLSGIGIISEVAKHELENKRLFEVKNFLDKISINTEETLGKMSDIIWAINPLNDSFEKIVNRLESYAKNATTPLGIQLHIRKEESAKPINLNMQQRNNTYLICKEAISNAIKYSGCHNLSFTLHVKDHHVAIRIVDDGTGFDILKDFDGNGLKNMKSRAEEIKAEISLNSEKGKGTSILLTLKIT